MLFEHLTKQYDVISSLEKERQLYVRSNGSLAWISSNRCYSFIVKWLIRITGFGKTDSETLVAAIVELNKKTLRIIELSDAGKETEIDSLKKQIGLASKKFCTLKTSYPSAGNIFEDLSRATEGILQAQSKPQIPFSMLFENSSFPPKKEAKLEIVENNPPENKPQENDSGLQLELVESPKFDHLVIAQPPLTTEEMENWEKESLSISQHDEKEKESVPAENNSLSISKSDFVFLEENSDVVKRRFVKLEKEIPYFDTQIATSFVKNLEKSFGEVEIGSEERWNESLERLMAVLKSNPLDPKKKQFVSEMIAYTLHPPMLGNGTALRFLSFDKLLALLQTKDLFEKVDPRYFAEDTTIDQKLLLLSYLNFTDPKKLLKEGSLSNKMLGSIHLHTFLIHHHLHAPQTYRQTCIGAAHNLHFQRHSGTIAELLFIAQNTMDYIEDSLSKIPSEKKQEPAYTTYVGKAPTKEEFVTTILKEAKKRITELETQVEKLMTPPEKNTKEIATLSRQWNFIMQDLETILDPEKPRIYSSQLFPDQYYVSALFSVVFTGLGQFMPAGAKLSDRWISLNREKLKDVSKREFGMSEKKLVYKHSYNDSDAPTLNELKGGKLWKQVHDLGGAFIDYTSISGQHTTGHTVYVEAVLIQDAEMFILYDSMAASTKKMDAKQFEDSLKETYEKQNGNTVATNHMFFYQVS